MSNNFIRKGTVLKENFKKKVCYSIPITIDSAVGGTKYKFKVEKNVYGLEIGKFYSANYKLIKYCSDEVWEKIKNIK